MAGIGTAIGGVTLEAIEIVIGAIVIVTVTVTTATVATVTRSTTMTVTAVAVVVMGTRITIAPILITMTWVVGSILISGHEVGVLREITLDQGKKSSSGLRRIYDFVLPGATKRTETHMLVTATGTATTAIGIVATAIGMVATAIGMVVTAIETVATATGTAASATAIGTGRAETTTGTTTTEMGRDSNYEVILNTLIIHPLHNVITHSRTLFRNFFLYM